jgi:hypothetical protein
METIRRAFHLGKCIETMEKLQRKYADIIYPIGWTSYHPCSVHRVVKQYEYQLYDIAIRPYDNYTSSQLWWLLALFNNSDLLAMIYYCWPLGMDLPCSAMFPLLIPHRIHYRSSKPHTYGLDLLSSIGSLFPRPTNIPFGGVQAPIWK